MAVKIIPDPAEAKGFYTPLPSWLDVADSPIHGKGIFATQDLEEGVILGRSHIELSHEGERLFVRTPLGGFINHAPEPNCVRRKLDDIFWYVVATQPINAGEEITLEYTEYNPTT